MKDFKHARRGVPHLNVSGKGEKTRYLPLSLMHRRRVLGDRITYVELDVRKTVHVMQEVCLEADRK